MTDATAPQSSVLTPPTSASTSLVETSASAIAARERAQVEARYLVALKQPRDMNDVRVKLLEACKRPRFAEAARYAKPVGTKTVVGFSIRFAEEVMRCMGNMEVGAFVTHEGDERRQVRSLAVDLERNNIAWSDIIIEKAVERKSPREGTEILRKRLNSQGEATYLVRATEDDLLNKANALLSKTRRNNILALFPADILDEALEQINATKRKEVKEDPGAVRKRISDAFYELGVMPSDLPPLLGDVTLDQASPAQLELLRTIYTALRDGETTWAEVRATFAAGADAEHSPKRGAEALKERLRSQGPPETAAQAGTIAEEHGGA